MIIVTAALQSSSEQDSTFFTRITDKKRSYSYERLRKLCRRTDRRHLTYVTARAVTKFTCFITYYKNRVIRAIRVRNYNTCLIFDAKDTRLVYAWPVFSAQ